MNPEEKELLQRAVSLSENNNEMLRSIQRSMRVGRIMTLIYWVFIIGSAVGAYYLVQPYVEGITETYTGAKSNFDTGLDNLSGISDTIQKFKSQFGN